MNKRKLSLPPDHLSPTAVVFPRAKVCDDDGNRILEFNIYALWTEYNAPTLSIRVHKQQAYIILLLHVIAIKTLHGWSILPHVNTHT